MKKRRKELNLDEWEDWSDEEPVETMSCAAADDITEDSETDSPDSEYRDSLEDIRRRKINVHLIFIALGVVLIAVIAIKLFIWNKGTPSNYDPNNLSTDFDTDVLDVIFPVMPSALEGRENDGVQTVLCLGNDTFADDRDDSDNLASILSRELAKKLKDTDKNKGQSEAVVYNGSFAATTVSNEAHFISDDTLSDLFNLYWVVNSLCQQDFTLQENALLKVKGDGHYSETVEMLKGLDMDKIDTLVIFYDALDYQLARTVTDPNSKMDTSTYIGAMSSALKLFKETYPYVRIIVMSPTFIQFIDEDGAAQSGDTWDVGNGSIPNYLLHLIDTTQDYGVSILDNYYGSVTVDNYEDYLKDASHLNKKGRKLIAERLVAILP